MKILLLNSSPRHNGNTAYATEQIKKSIELNTTHSVESVNVTNLKVSGCVACDSCRTNSEICVIKDDTQDILNKIVDADAIVFLAPVYWWGVPSQLKAVIDKFYSVQSKLKAKTKKIGIVTIGTSDITNRQYSLISDQFDCINEFLGWEKIFDLSFSAREINDLPKLEGATEQLSNISQYLV